MPPDYPKSPPKATFRTRIFHPNVDETTGAVCLETLKRDWDPKLTLKDILVTISCLLIQPNPDSALNEKAGMLVREDFDGFTRQAKLMTRIHAPIPTKLKSAVEEAKRRGEDDSEGLSKAQSSMHTLAQGRQIATKVTTTKQSSSDNLDSTKENTPSQQNHAKRSDPSTNTQNVLGKRSLAALAQHIEGDDLDSNVDILLPAQSTSQPEEGERPRKSPKHAHSRHSGRQGFESDMHDHNNTQPAVLDIHGTINLVSAKSTLQLTTRKAPAPAGKYRSYARVGIKRL